MLVKSLLNLNEAPNKHYDWTVAKSLSNFERVGRRNKMIKNISKESFEIDSCMFDEE